MKGFFNKPARVVDVALQVTEPHAESKTVLNSQVTHRAGNRSAQNRAKASERLNRPEGTKISVIASGESGSLDYLLEGGPYD